MHHTPNPNAPHAQPIINSSSIQAFQPSSQLLDYAATKGATVNFTKGLTAELAGKVSASTLSRPAQYGLH
jgi:short-subunit dehydrogenase